MAKLQSSTGLWVESIMFAPSVKPPGATTTFFLGGAGVRGMEIQGNFVKFTGIGVYLEDKAISSLAVKWKGKSAQELTDSVEFYRDIVTVVYKMCDDRYGGHLYPEKDIETFCTKWEKMVFHSVQGWLHDPYRVSIGIIPYAPKHTSHFGTKVRVGCTGQIQSHDQ